METNCDVVVIGGAFSGAATALLLKRRRPAKVASLVLGGVGANELEVRVGDETRRVVAKWVVDASGRAAVIARQLGLWRQNTEHPINSLWARFSGVKDFDGCELRDRFP